MERVPKLRPNRGTAAGERGHADRDGGCVRGRAFAASSIRCQSARPRASRRGSIQYSFSWRSQLNARTYRMGTPGWNVHERGPYRQPRHEPEVTWRAPVPFRQTWWAPILLGLAFGAMGFRLFQEFSDLEAGRRAAVLTDPFTGLLYTYGGRWPAMIPVFLMATALLAVGFLRLLRKHRR
jgi:hypothetical protein